MKRPHTINDWGSAIVISRTQRSIKDVKIEQFGSDSASCWQGRFPVRQDRRRSNRDSGCDGTRQSQKNLQQIGFVFTYAM
jgi:hypothetical protein